MPAFDPDNYSPLPNDVVCMQGSLTTFLMAADAEYSAPIVLPRTVIKGIIMAVTTLGTAGAAVRAGLRNCVSPAYPAPGALVIDAGTQPATTNGPLTYTFAPFIWPGGPLFVTAVSQNAPSTRPTIRMVNNADIVMPSPGITDPQNRFQLQTGITGALPTAFTSAGGIAIGPLAGVIIGDIKDVRPA